MTSLYLKHYSKKKRFKINCHESITNSLGNNTIIATDRFVFDNMNREAENDYLTEQLSSNEKQHTCLGDNSSKNVISMVNNLLQLSTLIKHRISNQISSLKKTACVNKHTHTDTAVTTAYARFDVLLHTRDYRYSRHMTFWHHNRCHPPTATGPVNAPMFSLTIRDKTQSEKSCPNVLLWYKNKSFYMIKSRTGTKYRYLFSDVLTGGMGQTAIYPIRSHTNSVVAKHGTIRSQ